MEYPLRLFAAASIVVVGCSAEGTAPPLIVVGATAVEVPVATTREMSEPPSWDYVEQQLGTGPGASSATPVAVFEIEDGFYDGQVSTVISNGCLIDRSMYTPAQHGIFDPGASGSYVTEYFSNGKKFDSRACELLDARAVIGAPVVIEHPYRCATSVDRMDLHVFNIDAQIVITNVEFGVWTGTFKFRSRQEYTITCTGTECFEDPAWNVFGLIGHPMPCSGSDEIKYFNGA